MANLTRTLFLFVLCFLTFYCGCSCSGKKIRLTENPSETRSAILQVIGIGTPVQKARKIMQQYGFQCSMMKDKPFSANKHYYEHLNYLYCDKSRGSVVSRRWQVAIVHQNSVVSDVLVSTGLTGP